MYVGLPNKASRLSILHALLKGTPLSPAISQNNFEYLAQLAERTQRLSGADMSELVNRCASASARVVRCWPLNLSCMFVGSARRFAIKEHLASETAGSGSGTQDVEMKDSAAGSSGNSSSAATGAPTARKVDALLPEHFERAFVGMRPSVSDAQVQLYKSFNTNLSAGNGFSSKDSAAAASSSARPSAIQTSAQLTAMLQQALAAQNADSKQQSQPQAQQQQQPGTAQTATQTSQHAASHAPAGGFRDQIRAEIAAMRTDA